MPTHHIPTEALIAYATGAATVGEELLVACHLTWCPRCRAVAAALDVVRAEIAAKAPPVATTDGDLAAVWAAVDSAPATSAPTPSCPVLPRPLVKWVGPLEQIAWGAAVKGVRAARLPTDGPQRVFLLDFPPEMPLPVHDHGGLERALVLRGGFSDDRSHFGRGDVSWRADDGHAVRIDPGERCTTLFVNDGTTDVGIFTPHP